MYTLPRASPYDDVLSSLSRLQHSVNALSNYHPELNQVPRTGVFPLGSVTVIGDGAG